MLTNEQIMTVAKKAAFVAQFMLGFSRPYSIAFLDDPFIRKESQYDPVKNEILINLALLEPFSERPVITQYEKQVFWADRDYGSYSEPERYNPNRLQEQLELDKEAEDNGF